MYDELEDLQDNYPTSTLHEMMTLENWNRVDFGYKPQPIHRIPYL